jgi:hypothetical protein
MVRHRKFPSPYYYSTNNGGFILPRAASSRKRIYHRPVVLFGVGALLSVVIVANVLSVANLSQGDFTFPDPASKSSATISNTEGGAQPLLPAGRRAMERQEGQSVGIFSDNVNLNSSVAPSPRRQLQAKNVGGTMDLPPSSSSSSSTTTKETKETTKDSADHTINTKAYFIKRGNKFYVTSRDALDLHDHLPPLTYSIGVDPMGEFHLQTIDSFELHGNKIYGDTKRQASRILHTFMDRKGSTGVMLAGEQGSGKTFLAKYIAVQAAKEYNIPTVVVNQALSGERFNAFVQSIQQPTIFLFDEFEKIYAGKKHRPHHEFDNFYDGNERGPNDDASGESNPNQDGMLTLLDGTYTTKMLFILTTNNKNKVSAYMRNRPGRIYYVIDFAGLSEDFIREYCNDKVKDKTKIPQILAVAALFEAFSFDMLQALVEEMNRYDETPGQVLDFLNVRPEFARGTNYLIQKLVVDGEVILPQKLASKTWYGNPLNGDVFVLYQKARARNQRAEPASDDRVTPFANDTDAFYTGMFHPGDNAYLAFATDDIVGMDATTGTFEYWNDEKKARLIIKKLDTKANSKLSANGLWLQKLALLQAPADGGKPQ